MMAGRTEIRGYGRCAAVPARAVAVLCACLLFATSLADLQSRGRMGRAIGAWFAAGLEPVLGITTWSDDAFRFRDVADIPYAEPFRESFSYADARVRVWWEDRADTFRGRLKAEGLKPHFAYQMKLVGRPTAIDPGGDDDANRVLGRVGRWWREAPSPGNARDDEVAQYGDDPEYVYTGYLLFDFFVTDGNGAADVAFAADSSLHVLWKVSQRSPGSNDTDPRTVAYVTDPLSPAYDVARSASVRLFGEWEPGRAQPGELTLPDGRYRCRLLLTEESFHQTGTDLGGQWAAAIATNVDFLVGDGTAASPVAPAFTAEPDGGGPLAFLQLSLSANVVRPGETITLRVSADGRGVADVYAALIDPNGHFRCLRGDGTLAEERDAIVPHTLGWSARTIDDMPLCRLPVTRTRPPGRYTWHVTLVEPGASPSDTDRVLASKQVTFEVIWGNGG